MEVSDSFQRRRQFCGPFIWVAPSWHPRSTIEYCLLIDLVVSFQTKEKIITVTTLLHLSRGLRHVWWRCQWKRNKEPHPLTSEEIQTKRLLWKDPALSFICQFSGLNMHKRVGRVTPVGVHTFSYCFISYFAYTIDFDVPLLQILYLIVKKLYALRIPHCTGFEIIFPCVPLNNYHIRRRFKYML